MIEQELKKRSGTVISIIRMSHLAWQAHPKAFVSLVITQLLQGIFPVTTAWITKQLFDLLAIALQDRTRTDLAKSFLLLIAAQGTLAVLSQLITSLQFFFNSEVNRNLRLTTQEAVYQRIADLEGVTYFENPKFYDTIRLATQGVQSGPSQILNAFTGLLRSIVILISFFGTLIFFSPPIAGIVILASLPQLYSQLKISHQRYGVGSQNSPKERQAFYFGNVLSNVAYVKEIRLFDLSRYFLKRLLQTTQEIQSSQRQQQVREIRWQIGLGFLSSVVSSGAFIVIMLQAFAGNISLGDVTLFNSALGSIQNALVSIILLIGSLNENILFFSHFTNLVAMPPSLSVVSSSCSVPPLRSKIELRNISFRYSEEHPWVLKNVNLTIPYNNCLALVGLNGAGKTTLVKLLARLYDPTEGEILWDGIDIREFEPKEFRKHLSAVFQDFVRFDLTARENLGLGNVEEIDNLVHIQQVANKVGIHTLLNNLPTGYSTVLSRWLVEDGVGTDLSGGQWQKIAIGRMLMREADFLILDEPTAALDAKTEFEIFRHFTSLAKERTSLLISHRFSTVRLADIIAVLEDGEITEYGTHDELIQCAGRYSELYQMQAEQYLR